MHLEQSGFIYSACDPFTKNKKRIKIIKETGHSRYINQNGLDKACFQHDMSDGDFQDLTRKYHFCQIMKQKCIQSKMKNKSIAAERFIRISNKIYEDVTLVAKNVYIDKIDDIANKYKNT